MTDHAHRTFAGYRRADGRVGVRNHVLVLSPTGLTSAAAQRIAGLVRGTIAVTSGFGRGQVAADAALHFDTLAGLARHPNVAAVLVVSAADDITGTFVDAVAASGKPVVGMSLPGVQADALTLVDRGVRAATRLVRDASALRREPCDVGALCVAVECGHSDASSGIVCNPLAGRMMEHVVAAGGQAIFSPEDRRGGPAPSICCTARRAATPDIAQKILAAVVARERQVTATGGDIRAGNPGQQNKAGGLTTIEEKALGAIAKGGNQPIRGLLRPAERPEGSGLFLMDTPYFSPESITAMVAAGAQLVIFTTGAGNSYCSLVAPTVKMSANPQACAALTEQIDIAAHGVLEGSTTPEAMAEGGVRAVAGDRVRHAHVWRDRRRRQRSGEPPRAVDLIARGAARPRRPAASYERRPRPQFGEVPKADAVRGGGSSSRRYRRRAGRSGLRCRRSRYSRRASAGRSRRAGVPPCPSPRATRTCAAVAPSRDRLR